MVCWVHLSGAEEFFSWLDIDANWHGATWAVLLCVGAVLPWEVLLPPLSTEERGLRLSGEPARCLGSFARGIKIAQAKETQGWPLIRQKHRRSLISLGTPVKAPGVLWMLRAAPGMSVPARSQSECVIVAPLLPCGG